MSLFIVGLDITVVNVALPSIGRELHAGISGLQWTVGAYTVVMASLPMFSGSMADRLGRKRIFRRSHRVLVGIGPVQPGNYRLGSPACMAIMTVVTSPLSGRMVGRRGPRLSLLISGVSSVIACAMLTGIDPATPIAWLVAAYAIFGVGFGFVNAPITDTTVSGMPRSQAGVASAIATTSRQVGQTLGVAAVGAIVTSRVGESVHADLSSASHPAWWTLTACGGVVLLLGFLATAGRARASARRTAAELNPSSHCLVPRQPTFAAFGRPLDAPGGVLGRGKGSALAPFLRSASHDDRLARDAANVA